MFGKRDKKGFIKFGIFTVIICIITIILLSVNPVICIENTILRCIVGLLYILLFLISLVSFIVFIELLICSLIGKYITKKNLKKIQSLTNEFRPISLIPNGNPLSTYIPNEEIKCMAKLDEDGKIIYKIQVDIESSTKNYNAFLSEFKI